MKEECSIYVVILTSLSALRKKVFIFLQHRGKSSPVPQLLLGPFEKLNKLTCKRLSSLRKQLLYNCVSPTSLQISVQFYTFFPFKPFDKAIRSHLSFSVCSETFTLQITLLMVTLISHIRTFVIRISPLFSMIKMFRELIFAAPVLPGNCFCAMIFPTYT